MKRRIMVSVKHLLLALSIATLAGCQATGEQYRSDVYRANQVNQAQQVQTVEIIAIQPARIAVDNQQDRALNQGLGTVIGGVIGGLLGNAINDHHGNGAAVGAIAGAALGAGAASLASPNENLVSGVQLTFKLNGRLFNSAQVGQMCEFKLGPAIMTSTDPTSTRIQPNNPYGCQPAQ